VRIKTEVITELPDGLKERGSVWGLKELNAIAAHGWTFKREVEPTVLDWQPSQPVVVRRVIIECRNCHEQTVVAARLYHKTKACRCRGGNS